MRKFFNHLVDANKLVSAYDFSNKRLIFPAVVANERFTLLTLSGDSAIHNFSISILNQDVSDLKLPGRVWVLSTDDLGLVNPNTRTCPLFQTSRDAELVQQIYQCLPVLIKEGNVEENPWGIFYLRMLDMTLDSGLFKDLEELQEMSTSSPSPNWLVGEDIYLSLLEGKLFDSFNFRHGTFAGIHRNERFGTKAEPNHPNLTELNDPNYKCLPRYWVLQDEIHHRYKERLPFIPSGILTFRDVCRTHTDLRTVRACINPPLGAGNKAPLLLFPSLSREEHARRSLLLCTNLTSFVFDYVARQKFSGGSLNKYVLIQLPVITPNDSKCLMPQL